MIARENERRITIAPDPNCVTCDGEGWDVVYDKVDFWGMPCMMDSSDVCDCVIRQLPDDYNGEFYIDHGGRDLERIE